MSDPTNRIVRNISPIFVVGAPRSGTTLLAQLLSDQSNLFIYNETVYFDFVENQIGPETKGTDLVSACAQYLIDRVAWTADKQVEGNFGCTINESEKDQIIDSFHAATKGLGIDASPFDIFTLFMEMVASAKGVERWGEKTPNHVFFMEQLLDEFPKAKFVHVVRDPRIFMRSYKFAWKMHGAKNPDHARRLYHPYFTLMIWRRAIEAVDSFRHNHGKEACLEVRYEDLTANPVGELKRISKYIGENFEDKVELPDSSNSSFRVGKSDLFPWEIEVCEWLCRKELVNYKYKTDKNYYPNYMALARSWVSLPIYLFKIIPIVHNRFGGKFLPYLRSRRILPQWKQ